MYLVEYFIFLTIIILIIYLTGNHDKNLDLDVSLIDIYFYDFPNNITETYAINCAAEAILSDKHVDKNRKFVMFVGGFKSQIKKKTEEQIRQAYKNYPNSYLIIPDHSVYTNNNAGSKKGYERSVKYVHYIGKALGNMLVDLSTGGICRKNIHCVGHSLGAQMLSHTGETFLNLTGKKISKITALDPAGPCFSNSLINEQIRSGVADYVEVYHCNSGGFGTSSILGDVDFIVNKKGETQPQCSTPIIPGFLDSPKAATCNHRVCIDVWTASIKNSTLFPAYRCDSYKSFKSEKCSLNDKTFAGEGNPGTAKGMFYFSTQKYDLNKIK